MNRLIAEAAAPTGELFAPVAGGVRRGRAGAPVRPERPGRPATVPGDRGDDSGGGSRRRRWSGRDDGGHRARPGRHRVARASSGRSAPARSASAWRCRTHRCAHCTSLGLLEAVVDRSYHHEAVNICAPDGTVVHRVVTEPLVPGTPPFVALARVALAGILERGAGRDAGADIRYGTTFTALRDLGDRSRPTSPTAPPSGSTSSSVPTGCTRRCGNSASRTRPAPRRARQVIWRGSAPRPPEADRYLLHSVLDAPRPEAGCSRASPARLDVLLPAVFCRGLHNDCPPVTFAGVRAVDA